MLNLLPAVAGDSPEVCAPPGWLGGAPALFLWNAAVLASHYRVLKRAVLGYVDLTCPS